ncbi:MAG: preprotein translocase subunit SecG [Thermomicrobiales bacterium]
MDLALDVVQIIVCVLLILVILTQSKGSGFSGTFGGDSGSIYRTRRGVEKTLFQYTIAIGVIFLVLSIVASIVD